MVIMNFPPFLWFSKGFDTIIAGLQWSLLYLIKFPDIQDKIHQEIGDALCSNKTNSYAVQCARFFTKVTHC